MLNLTSNHFDELKLEGMLKNPIAKYKNKFNKVNETNLWSQKA